MNLTLNEDQIMIRDMAERFLADASDSPAVRRAMDSDSGYDAAVWQQIGSELGWCGVAIDEAHGGLGLGVSTLALIQEQAGRRLLCAPFFATVCVAAPLIDAIATMDARAQWLPQIASGEQTFAVTLAGDLSGERLNAVRAGDGWQLSGRLNQVVDGGSADQLLVFAQVGEGDGDIGLFILSRASQGVRARALNTWDQARRMAEITVDNAAATRIDDPARLIEGLHRAMSLARIYLAAEQLGAAQQCLDMTLEYTATRKQFGRVIAGFQAVKHRCAQMMIRIEALRSAVQGTAAMAMSDAAPVRLALEAAMLRARAVDTAFYCAQEAIQLHGGVGFTWEYDPHLYFKRAQAAQHWLGAADRLIDGVGQVLTQAPAALLTDNADDTAENAAFRAEVAQWMRAHLTGRFASLQFRGGPGDEEVDPALRKEWERELASGGWTCVGWPQEAGGRGLSIQQQVIYFEEYARAGGPGRMGHIGEGLLGPALIRFGSEAQKQQFLPDIVAGKTFWAQGYSEPGAGSDLANVQTRAEQQADGRWVVNGQKIWTSLAHESDWIFVLARCEPGSKGHKGLIFLLMPLNQPGIEIRPIKQIGGGSEFNEVFFDGAIAQAEHVVGEPGDGWKVAMGLLEAERGVSTLGQQMHFAHELALVINAAKASGRINDPGICSRIAQAWSGLRVMRYNALRMLSKAENDLGREALMYKYFWSNWHRDLGELAMDVLGAQAAVVSDDPAIRPLQQLFFFSRSDTIYAGTNEIQLNLISERGLGMPREARPKA